MLVASICVCTMRSGEQQTVRSASFGHERTQYGRMLGGSCRQSLVLPFSATTLLSRIHFAAIPVSLLCWEPACSRGYYIRSRRTWLPDNSIAFAAPPTFIHTRFCPSNAFANHLLRLPPRRGCHPHSCRDHPLAHGGGCDLHLHLHNWHHHHLDGSC